MKKISLLFAIIIITFIITGCDNTFDIVVDYDTDKGSIEGAGTYEEGSTITLKAKSNEGYSLKEWILNDEVVSKSPGFTFKVTEDRTYEVVFTKQEPTNYKLPENYTINARSENESFGVVDGDGSYKEGEEATLIAIPKEGFEFLRWDTPDETLSEEKEFNFTVDDNYNIVARFKEKIDPDKERHSVKVTPNHPEAVYEIYTYQTKTGMLSNEFTENDEVSIQVTNLPPSLDDKTTKEKVSYRYLGLYDGDKLLTTDSKYNFAIKKDLTLEARFEPLSLDNFTINKSESKIYKDRKIPSQFSETLISPDKKYILSRDEGFLYVIYTSDKSLHSAYKIEDLLGANNDYEGSTWSTDCDGFVVHGSNGNIIYQLLDSYRVEVQVPDSLWTRSPVIDQWPNNSRTFESSYLMTDKLEIHPVAASNNFLFFKTELTFGFSNAILSLAYIDLDTMELYLKEFTQIYSTGEGVPFFPRGIALNKEKTKLLYSFNNGILPEKQPDTVTGYLDLEKHNDIEIDLPNLGNFKSSSNLNVHGRPLFWLNENQVLFSYVHFDMVPTIKHLYVLDIKNNEMYLIKYNEYMNSYFPIDNANESNKYENNMLNSSFSNENDTSTIYLNKINFELNDLTENVIEQVLSDHPSRAHSFIIERESSFILSRYNGYYDLIKEKLFEFDNDLTIRDAFLGSNDNLIITLSYSLQEREDKDKNKYYLVIVDKDKNYEVVYDSKEQFKAINVEKDSFTILKDNEIQRIDR